MAVPTVRSHRLASILHDAKVPVKRRRLAVLRLRTQKHVEASSGFLEAAEVLTLALENKDAFTSGD